MKTAIALVLLVLMLFSFGAAAFSDDAPAPAEPSPVVANDKGVYRVLVTDESGEAVKGAMVQFCDDTACMTGKTDEKGVAVFPDAAEGHPYTVHILKVPAGYEMNEEEFSALSSYCDVSIVLQKKD